jgi:hypothetical protein
MKTTMRTSDCTAHKVNTHMDLHTLCISLRERHENGESYQTLAYEYGVSKPVIGRLIAGKRPGRKVAAILNLDASPALTYTRKRRETLNARAVEWGYRDWSAYETAMMTWKIP